MTSAFASGTQTATINTEHILSAPNSAGNFRLILDLSVLADGDVVELRAYQMVLTGGTSRVADVIFKYGAQPVDEQIFQSLEVPNELTDTNAVKFTLKQTAGTGRAFPWKVMNLDSGSGSLTAANIWDYLLTSITTAGSIGKLIKDNLDVVLSTRLASASYTAPPSVVAIADGVWDEDMGAHGAVGSAGSYLNSILAALSTVAADVWANATRTLTAISDSAGVAALLGRIASAITITGGKVDVNDKTGFSLLAGQLLVKRNTALNNFEFLMRSSSDHVTPVTGLTVSATRSIDGGAFAAAANAVTEVGSGVYKINMSAADLNGTVITFLFTATGADARYLTIVTQA